MTKDEAVEKALDYVRATALEVGPVADVRYVSLTQLEEKARDCPRDLLETYNSVRKAFRNQWVVAFKVKEVAGQVSCPETRLVSVFDNGEVGLFS
jgi:hypothetical protein